MTESGIVQHSPVRGMTAVEPDPIEKDLVAQNLIVEWANATYSKRVDSITFATTLGIKELDLWHWVNRLADRIRKLRAAKVEAKHGMAIDEKVAELAEAGSPKHAAIYYKHVENRKESDSNQLTNIQVNVGIPD